MVTRSICIAFLGFDSDRIYLPFAEYGCSKLYLIKRHEKEHETAAYNLELIRENMPPGTIEEMRVPHDVFLRINCLKRIFEREKENRVYLNISTGSKLDAIAGMIAAMLFNNIPRELTPFYAHPKGGGRGKSKTKFSETRGVSKIEEVPVLDLQKPDDGALGLLNILNENGGKMQKQRMVERLCKERHLEGYDYVDGFGIVKTSSKEETEQTRRESSRGRARKLRTHTSGAIHVAENRVFRALKTRWGAIDEEDRPKNRSISLTKNGQILCKIFFGGETETGR